MAQSVIAATHIGLFYHGSYAENTNLHRYVHGTYNAQGCWHAVGVGMRGDNTTPISIQMV